MREAAHGVPTVFDSLVQGARAREARIALAQELTVPRSESVRGRSRWAPLHTFLLLQSGLALTLFLACAPDAKATNVIKSQPRPAAATLADNPTAVASGGEVAKPNSMEQRISSGQATPDEIREFNKVALERASITTWVTEKGEVKQLPQIEGLRAIGYALNNRLETVYFAKENNPYGLEVNSIAGIFHKEVFDVQNIENNTQVGGVILRSEIIKKMLSAKGSPESVALIPLGVDPSTAIKDRGVLVQETISSLTGSDNEVIMAKFPEGATMTIPVQAGERPISLQVNPQNWGGTSISLRFAPILGRYEYSALYADSLLRQTTKDSKLGDPIGFVTSKQFPKTDQEVVKLWTKNANIYFNITQPFTDDGIIHRLGFTRKNLLKQDGSYVLVMANNNRLIAQGK